MGILKDLDTYESLVRHREYELAYKKFLSILQKTSVHRSKKDEVFSNLDDESLIYVYCRFASTTFQFFLDDGFLLTENGFRSISYFGRNFATILAMTPYKNADHVIRHLIGQSEADEEQKESVNIYSYRKMLFLWSIHSDVQLPFANFMRDHQSIVKYTLINALTLTCYVDHDVHQRREELLDLMADGEIELELDDHCLAFVGPVWMYTTYASTSKKHDAKNVINNAYRKWILSKGVREPVFPAKRKIIEKPTLVIMMEQMDIKHAMFRCFGESFHALKKKFNVIGMGVEGRIHENVHDAFHKVVCFPDDVKEMKKCVGMVLKQKPDMILYSSLGMQNAVIPLATLRLAPIQMMVLGHPAPSRMPEMDYVIMDDGLIRDGTCYTEKIIWLKSGEYVFRDPGDTTSLHENTKKLRGEKSGLVKVAIPSFAMKISDPFISLLERIRDKCESDIEFNFFPYLTDMSCRLFEETIKKRLPNAIVHQPKMYRDYMATLGACDIHFGQFPFNNGNGNIDSVKMGMPMIVLESDTTEGSVDALMLRYMGAPEDSIAKDMDDYLNKSIKLIEDVEYRLEIQEKMENLDITKTYFNTDKHMGIVDAVENTYLYHESIQSSDQQVIKFDEFIPALVLDKVGNE